MRMSNSIQESSQRNKTSQADSKDANDFRDALDGDGEGSQQNKNADKDKPSTSSLFEGSNNPFSQMTNPLDSLANRSVAQAQATAQTSQSDVNSKLVETILVSQPDADSQEIRLTVSRDILPDTEIRISRDIHGTLNVSLISNNASSFQTLVGAQNDLKSLLEQSENNVQVHVDSGDAGDTSQQSRGFMEYEEEK